MLKKVASVFALTAAVAAAAAFAQERPESGPIPPTAVTAKKVVIDETKKMDVIDTAMQAGTFKTLGTALHAAGLVETLKGQGPFTVFAPTDEAFAKLPMGTLESLLRPENKDKLVAILTYHVVAGDEKAAQIAKLKSAKTVNGQSLTITTQGDSVMIDNAKVLKTDIVCTNGVIHVIDTVLMPKE